MSPAVNLALEEVPFAILEVVKARILANRRRLGAGQDQQKPPPSLKPRPQLRKFGASSKNYRRPEPAATGGQPDPTYGLAFLSVGVDDEGTPNTRIRVAYGDGSKDLYLTGEFFFVDPNAQPLLLPINSTSAIIVSLEANNIRCVYVGYTSVRVVPTPGRIASLVNVLSAANADPPPLTGSYTYIASEAFKNFRRIKFTDIAGGFRSGANISGPVGNRGPRIYISGPGIYSFLKNPASAYAAGNRAETLQGLYNYVANAPLPAKSTTVYNRVPFIDYMLTYNGPVPPVGDYEPVNDVLNPVWRQSRQPTKVPGFKDNYFTESDGGYLLHYMWWDWGKPNYCREQLLALGFTEANITP